MQKLAAIVFFVSIPIACSSQQPHSLASGSVSDGFPDAPHSQLATLFWQFAQKSMHATLNPALPHADATGELDGARATLCLLSAVSSKSSTGFLFQARIDQSLVLQGRIALPAGTIFEGHLHTTPARRMMRPGSMFMTFDRMILPNGDTRKVDVHLVDAATAAAKADVEGRLHPGVNKKRLAIQLGATALAAKFADDLAELAGGTAVGAGSARFIGAGAAATFFLLQKGSEVKLNIGDKLEVEFGRTIVSPSGATTP